MPIVFNVRKAIKQLIWTRVTLAELTPVHLCIGKHLSLYEGTGQWAVALCVVFVNHAQQQLARAGMVKRWHSRILAQKKAASAAALFCWLYILPAET